MRSSQLLLPKPSTSTCTTAAAMLAHMGYVAKCILVGRIVHARSLVTSPSMLANIYGGMRTYIGSCGFMHLFS
jgi:hypothetical protein